MELKIKIKKYFSIVKQWYWSNSWWMSNKESRINRIISKINVNIK